MFEDLIGSKVGVKLNENVDSDTNPVYCAAWTKSVEEDLTKVEAEVRAELIAVKSKDPLAWSELTLSDWKPMANLDRLNETIVDILEKHTFEPNDRITQQSIANEIKEYTNKLGNQHPPVSGDNYNLGSVGIGDGSMSFSDGIRKEYTNKLGNQHPPVSGDNYNLGSVGIGDGSMSFSDGIRDVLCFNASASMCGTVSPEQKLYITGATIHIMAVSPVDALITALRSDPDYYRPWRDNISMAFQDEYTKHHNLPCIKNIADRAAEYFLNQLIGRIPDHLSDKESPDINCGAHAVVGYVDTK